MPRYHFTVTARYASGAVGSKDYSILIADQATAVLAFTPLSISGLQVGSLFSQLFTPSGGSGTGYTFAIASGALPAGLTLSGSTISGTPTTAGAYSFTMVLTDSAGNTASQVFSGTVAAAGAGLSFLPASLSSLQQGVAFTQALTPSGGSGSGYTFSVAAGSLPAGLTLSGSTIAGTPTASGAYLVTILLTDSLGATFSRVYSGSVVAAGAALDYSPTSISGLVVGSVFSQAFTPVGGSGAGYVFSVSAGALPAGLTLSGATIAGTPTTVGAYSFTLLLTDSLGATASYVFSGTVAATVSTLVLTVSNQTVIGLRPQSYQVTAGGATGGTAPYTWTASSTNSNIGIVASGSSAILTMGDPSGWYFTGSYTVTITVTDSLGATRTQTITVTHNDVRISFASPAIHHGASAVGETTTLGTVFGGSGTYTLVSQTGVDAAYFTLEMFGSTLRARCIQAVGAIDWDYPFTVVITDSSGGQAYKAGSLIADSVFYLRAT